MIFSCGGDGDDDAGPSGSGTMSAKISGTVSTNFSASGSLGGQNLVTAQLNSPVLSIVGNDGGSPTTNQINIAIGAYDGPGTYEFGITTGNTATFSQTTVDVSNPTDFENLSFTALSGSVEVSENGDSYEGTFTFSAQGNDETTVEVTEGSFNASPAEM